MREGLIYKLVEKVKLKEFTMVRDDYFLRFSLSSEKDRGWWCCEKYNPDYYETVFFVDVPWEKLFDQFNHVEVARVADERYKSYLHHVDVSIYDLGIMIRFDKESEERFVVLPIGGDKNG